MKDFSIAFRYNVWLRLGWICIFPSFIGLALSIWSFAVHIDDYSASLRASRAVEVSVCLFAFSGMLIVITRNGRGTLRTFRKSVRLIEHNKMRLEAGASPLNFPWQVKPWANTYCQRAGVVAAACEHDLARELPRRYQKWWNIVDTRSRTWASPR